MFLKNNFKIAFCSDSKSWINQHISNWVIELKAKTYDVQWCHNVEELYACNVCFILGYERIISQDLLKKNNHNLIVHESDLPKGRGWSPLTWQVLKGKNKVAVTLFEASDKIDEGHIYIQDYIYLNGTELVDELRKKQAEVTYKLCNSFLQSYPKIINQKKIQKGQASYYKKRNPQDSKLDINLNIKDQFNLLRTCDNEKYPAWFEFKGKKYILAIFKDKNKH